MNSEPLATIIADLEQQHARLATCVASRRSELEADEANLARMDAAIRTLSGGAPAAPPTASVGKRKKLLSAAPKKLDVVHAMFAILKVEVTLEAEPLKVKVEESLGKRGFSRAGFAMRFKEACNDKLFVETPAGYRIADEKSTKAPFRSDESTTCHSSGATATQSDNSITSFTGAIKGNSTTASKGSTTTRSSN